MLGEQRDFACVYLHIMSLKGLLDITIKQSTPLAHASCCTIMQQFYNDI